MIQAEMICSSIDKVVPAVAQARRGGHELGIDIAGTRYLLRGLDQRQYDELSARFGINSRQGNVQYGQTVCIDVMFCKNKELAATQAIRRGEFVFDYAEAQTVFFSRGIYAELVLHPRLAGRLYIDLQAQALPIWGAENLLRMMVAYKVFMDGGLVIHSAAIALSKLGYLFYGVSGSGKSTLGKQIVREGGLVLSDDLNLVTQSNGTWRLHRMPFTGDLNSDDCYDGGVPLAGVFQLKRGSCNGIGSLGKGQCVASLLVCIPYLNNDLMRQDPVMERINTLLSSICCGSIKIAKGPLLGWLTQILEEGDDQTRIGV